MMRLGPSTALRQVRSYATAPTAKSSSSLPLLLGAAILVGGGAYFYSSGGKLPSPADVKAAEDKAKAALGAHTSSNLKGFLDPKAFVNLKLAEIENYNHDTKLFRFTLPEGYVSGLTTASCVVTKDAKDELKDDKDKPIIRPYTPSSVPSQEGFIEFIVKEYKEGKMSKHFHSLKVGDELGVKGPILKFEWKANEFDRIGLISGGSGITPAWQILQEIVDNPADKTKATLIYANKTEKDILIREKLDALQKKRPDQIEIIYTVDKPEKGWKGHTGFITPELLGKNLPPAGLADKTKVFVVGPPGQVAAVAGPKAGMKQGPTLGLLADLGYTESQVFKF